ncbi:hypothetical protein GCK32_005393 [Trichostrongylus colubriformis]|uniref:Uncharacterized protein n=1 Tax=Trichostrongylus colubriformis TaxID=6319 RepID=A0AAN8IPG2_TRICO
MLVGFLCLTYHSRHPTYFHRTCIPQRSSPFGSDRLINPYHWSQDFLQFIGGRGSFSGHANIHHVSEEQPVKHTRYFGCDHPPRKEGRGSMSSRIPRGHSDRNPLTV